MLSRVADSLYWMSRYFERADHCARVLEANYNLMLDPSRPSTEQRWHKITNSLGLTTEADGDDPQAAVVRLTSEVEIALPSFRALHRPAKTPAKYASRSAQKCGSA